MDNSRSMNVFDFIQMLICIFRTSHLPFTGERISGHSGDILVLEQLALPVM